MKRKLTLFLSVMMATSSLPMTAYAANFEDINVMPWASSVMSTAADRGLISGYNENGKKYCKPKNNVTYCEAMQMAYNVLSKTGVLVPVSAEKISSYMPMLNTYKVPMWAQPAVVYGLENNLINLEMVTKNFIGGNKAATREDVAKIFGNTLARRYSYEKVNYAAAEFKDYWQIDDKAASQVDLLKRLGILTGSNGYFYPKNNINRAEMAVILNKTYEVLTEGVAATGTIKSVTNNEGIYYTIEVETANGTEIYRAMPGNVKVYNGNVESALSRLTKGDSVKLVQNGGALSEIHILDAVSAQTKYDLTGYVSSMKDGKLVFVNENTGEEEDYTINSDCICYLEGKKVTAKQLQAAIAEDHGKHVFAGLFTEVKTETVKDSSGRRTKVNVVYITELHVDFTDGYTTAGKVTSFTNSAVEFRPAGTTAENRITFASDCTFYIGDKKTTKNALKDLYEGGTVYVKVTVGKDEYATKVIMSEDTFDTGHKSVAEDQIVKVKSFSEMKMVVEIGGKEVTYKFGSENPVSNIAFFTWDKGDNEWSSTTIKAGDDYAEEVLDAKDTLYAVLGFNSGGKLTTVDLSSLKKAWKDDVDTYTERKGTVESLEDGVLTFKTSDKEYTMLSTYNRKATGSEAKAEVGPGADGVDVRNPLVISSAWTSSLKVFEKLISDSDVEVYAEITANDKDQVVKIDARVTEAKGTLVKLDLDEGFVTIKTADGNELKLKTDGTPELTDEDEDTGFTIDSVATHGYVGSAVVLIFDEDGPVEEITVTDSAYSSGVVYVEGIATGAYDGLKVEGDARTYRWQSRSHLEIINLSSSSTDPEKLKAMIEDEDVEVYVKARISDHDDEARQKVEKITVYVREAVGTIVQFNEETGVLLLRTDAGNLFPLYVENGARCVMVDDIEYDDLADRGPGREVVLTFNSTGDAGLIQEL